MSDLAPLFACDSISVRLTGRDVVVDVSFALNAGELLIIRGENGSGKTTLLNALTGHLKVSNGRVAFDGRDITRWRPERVATLGVGRLFQQASAPTGFSVAECLLVTLAAARRLPSHRRSAALDEITPSLRDVGAHSAARFLAGCWESRLGELSFAQQRYVELVCSFVVGSRVLLLDEPFAGVDAANAAAMLQMIRKAREEGRAIIVVEHRTDLLRDGDFRTLELSDDGGSYA